MNLIEQDVIANGVRLHVARSAAARPALVFAHGITDNGLCFMPLAEKLADAFEIIVYDSRGHGLSEAPAVPGSALDRARDLAGLLGALGLHKPCLLGHSMGAVTVALMAGLYPDLPARIVLEDPPPFEMLAAHSEQDLAGRARWRAMAAQNKLKSTQELVELNRLESPAWPEAERLPWAQAKQQFSLSVFDEDYVEAALGNQIISQITCPTLILTADVQKGALYEPAQAEKLAASLPAGKHINIPGAGHSIRREQPAATLQAVRQFLEAPQ